MFAIETEYRNGKMLARHDGRKLVHGYRHELSGEDNHVLIAQEFLQKFRPNLHIVASGYMKPGFYAHVVSL